MKKNLLIGAMALSLVLSTGVVAFAATNANDTNKDQQKTVPAVIANMTEEQRDAVREARTDSMEEAVAELVEKGTITQDTADKLTEIKNMQVRDRGGLGALTDDQRAALNEAEAAELESQIDALVEDGTITQDQADQMAQGRMMLKGLDLTDEQRDALIQAKVAAVKAAVAALVEDGTLTQDEADVISTTPKANPPEDKPASILTEDQRTALSDGVKAKFESKLTELVDDGTITQDQADQLQDSSGFMHMGPGGRGGLRLCPAAE